MWQSLGTGFAAYLPFGSQAGHLITGSRTRTEISNRWLKKAGIGNVSGAGRHIKKYYKPSRISNPCILTYASAYIGSENPVVREMNRVELHN